MLNIQQLLIIEALALASMHDTNVLRTTILFPGDVYYELLPLFSDI